jgi:hypothetical protein
MKLLSAIRMELPRERRCPTAGPAPALDAACGLLFVDWRRGGALHATGGALHATGGALHATGRARFDWDVTRALGEER